MYFGLFASVMIGQSDYFGFSFTAVTGTTQLSVKSIFAIALVLYCYMYALWFAKKTRQLEIKPKRIVTCSYAVSRVWCRLHVFAFSSGYITMQWITQLVLLMLIHWIAIYPVDSAIHLLNNRGQQISSLDCFRLLRLPRVIIFGLDLTAVL